MPIDNLTFCPYRMIVCANKEAAYVLEMSRQWLLSFPIKIDKLKPQFGTTIRLDLSMQQLELKVL